MSRDEAPPVPGARDDGATRVRVTDGAARAELLDAWYQLTRDAVLLLDDHGTVVDADAAGAELLGLPLRRLRGRPLRLSVRDSDRSVLDDALRAAARGPEPVAVRVSIRGDDHDLAPVDVLAGRSDDDGVVVVLRTLGSEIALEAVASAMRRRGDELQQVIDLLHDVVAPDDVAVPGLDVAARYVSADWQAPVGGDRYDVQPLDDGWVHACVVDVTGSGASFARHAAALTMTLRTLALLGTPFEELLETATTLVRRRAPELSAAAVLLRVHPDSGRVRLQSAGHPPALLVPASGRSTLVTPTGPPLGYGVDGEREIVELVLAEDDALVLTSDGLVTSWVEPDEGLSRLRTRSESRSSGRDAATLADDLLHVGLAGDARRHDDDGLVLVVSRSRRAPAGDAPATVADDPFVMRPPLHLATLHELRRRLQRWLADRDVAAAHADDVLLVVSELTANAIRFAASTVEVRVRPRGGSIVVEVRDDGSGIPSSALARAGTPLAAGRGLDLVRRVADHVFIGSGSDGSLVRCTLDGDR